MGVDKLPCRFAGKEDKVAYRGTHKCICACIYIYLIIYLFLYLSLLIYLPHRTSIMCMDNTLMTTMFLFFPKDYLTNFCLTVTS